jgi:hypothetical protein
MAWTKTSAGGFTKYFQDIAASESDTITLAGAGCNIMTENDVAIATADSAGGLNDSYEYEALTTTAAGEEYTVPAGSHILKVTDPGGGSEVTVWVTKNAASQDTVTFSGIGADPS